MKRFVWPLLIALFVAGSFAPTVYELANQKTLHPDRQFELVHNYYTDYNFYLSRIREGIEGRWTAVERYTSEPHAGSLLHEMYVLMGQVGRFVRVPWHRAGDVYHMARLVLAVVLLALIAQYIITNLQSPMLAFLLAVTAGSWPKLVAVDGWWRFGGYMPWWSLMDTLQRISFIPHILAGQALIVFLVMALSDERVLQRPGNWVFLGGLAFVLGIVFPPGVIFLGAFLAVAVLLRWVWDKELFRTLLPYGVVLAFAVPALLYLNLMTSFYPWKRLVEFDVISPLPFNFVEYAAALGPVLPLGLLGLGIAFVRKERKMIAAIAWVVAWLGLLAVFRFVPQQSPLRFSEVLPHVPLALLAVYALRGRWKIVVVLLVLLGVGQMYSSYLWQKDFVDHKIRATLPLVPTGSYVMYPLKDVIDGIRFIQDNSDPGSVVLSETTAGNYIPVYAGRTVFVGHANTVQAEEKQGTVNMFFRGGMNQQEARKFLADHRVSLVFFGPQEKEDGGLSDLRPVYPFFIEVYKNSYVSVYSAP